MQFEFEIIPKKSKVYYLAETTLVKIEENYNQRIQGFINKNRLIAIKKLKESITINSDVDIVNEFQNELENQKQHTGSGGELGSFFINEVTHFISEAEGVMEIEALKQSIAALTQKNQTLQQELQKSQNTIISWEHGIKKAQTHNRTHSVFQTIVQDFIPYFLKFLGKREIGLIGLVSTVFYNEIRHNPVLNNIYRRGPFFPQFYLKDQYGKTHTIRARRGDRVEEIKKTFEEKTTLPVDQQRWTYSTRQLKDEMILSKCNIPKESTIHLSVRLRGD